MTDFARHLAGLIRHDGPMRLDRFMALANAHYYATRDPLGIAGDFTTAPEISQLFGEMIGLALVDHWQRAGAPAALRLVEIGPGRGSLMADILRAAAIRPAFIEAARISLVETSPVLRSVQARTLVGHDVEWADSLDEVPADAPLYLVANEFFDALPIRQFHCSGAAWAERYITLNEVGGFQFLDVILGPQSGPGDPCLSPSEQGAVVETSPLSLTIVAEIGQRLLSHGGLALIIDYGYLEGRADTFQAVRSHAFTDPLLAPGEADLTAHVDFMALARACGARTYGPVTQGALLFALGLETRAAMLARAHPALTGEVQAGATRLVDPDQMGTLFKAIALTGPGGPTPAGFPP